LGDSEKAWFQSNTCIPLTAFAQPDHPLFNPLIQGIFIMNTTALEHRHSAQAAVAAQTATPQTPRVDLYRMIHKALRKQMFEAVYGLGRADVNDNAEFNTSLELLLALTHACEAHLNKENAYVHLAMEARAPSSTGQILDEHFEHLEAIENLRQGIDRLRQAPASERSSSMHQLYLEASHFVGENLIHMRHEEQHHNAVLWATYSDAELLEIEQRIIASVEPQELMDVMEQAIPAQSHEERAGKLGGMKQGMPAPAFSAMVQLARNTLNHRDWDKLARAIGEPQVPGLVEIS
jgi:hypothetical protein